MMLFESVTYSLFLLVLIIGSYTDLKRREVPDWLNYGLIFAGFGIRIIFASAEWNVWYVLEGLFGFLTMLAAAYLLFLSGQVGGGDAKLLMGAGSILGLGGFDSPLVSFVVNLFIVGSLFGLIFSIYLMTRHWKSFKKEFVTYLHNPSTAYIRRIGLISSLSFVLLAVISRTFMLRAFFLVCVLFYYTIFYLYVFVKSIESSAMLKHIPPEQLTPGDWIPENIIVGGKRIAGPKDLGISEQQIRKLILLKKQRKIRTVLVKEGIPFVPSYLFGFLMTLWQGNLLFLFMRFF